MADEITLEARLRMSKGNLLLDKTTRGVTVDMTGTNYGNFTQVVGTAAENIAFPSDIATLGYCYMRNQDATNYVQLGVDSSGFVAFGRLKPGEVAELRLEPGATFQAKANTAPVSLEVFVIED